MFLLRNKKIKYQLQPLSCGLYKEDTHCFALAVYIQGSHRLEKYLNLEGFLDKSLKIKSALKSNGKSLQILEKSLNSTILGRT